MIVLNRPDGHGPLMHLLLLVSPYTEQEGLQNMSPYPFYNKNSGQPVRRVPYSSIELNTFTNLVRHFLLFKDVSFSALYITAWEVYFPTSLSPCRNLSRLLYSGNEATVFLANDPEKNLVIFFCVECLMSLIVSHCTSSTYCTKH